MPYGLEHPLGQLGLAVLAVSPPSFLCTSSPLAGGVAWRAAKALTVSSCGAGVEAPPVLSTPFPAEAQNRHCGRNNSNPAKPSTLCKLNCNEL